MFRRFFFLLFSFFPVLAFCADYSFNNVPLTAFARAVIKQGMKREFLIEPSVKDKQISLDISVSDDDAFSVIEKALSLHGILVKDDGQIIYLLSRDSRFAENSINPASLDIDDGVKFPIVKSQDHSLPDILPVNPESQEYDIKVYRPKFRDVSYLAEVVEFSGGKVLPSKAGFSSLLVYGVTDDEKADKVQQSLDLVDVAENSIYLHVVFIEVTGTDTAGFTLSGLIKLLSGRFSLDFGTSRTAGVGLSIKSTTIDSVLSVLDEQVTFKYLAEPSLAVVHGKEARLVVGSDVPLRGSVGRDSAGVTLQSVSYKTTGLQMTVKPLIYQDSVMIDGSFEVSSIAANSSSDIDSPLILRRSLSTVFPLSDGDVVILGGLDDERVSGNRSSFLGLPFGTRREVNTSRIIVLAEIRRGLESTAVSHHIPARETRRRFGSTPARSDGEPSAAGTNPVTRLK